METYEEIYQRMCERYRQESGAQFDEASDIAIRLRVLAGELYNMQTSMEWLKRQLFPSKATGEFLDRFALQRGLERRGASKATGTLRFSVNEVKSNPVVIPAGTVVSTAGGSPVRVYTTEDSEIPPLSYSVLVAAEAERAGYSGNINAQTATVPVSVPAMIDSVTNPGVFSGGADAESDTALRERILNSYTDQPNGMNAAYYKALALSVDGVERVGVLSRGRGAGTVDVYVKGEGDEISDVKLAEVQQVLSEARELNVNVQANKAYKLFYDMSVQVRPKPGYAQAEVEELVTAAFEDYVNAIPMGEKLYLSRLGVYLMDTGCIETYVFDSSMTDMALPASKYFVAGDATVEVI